MNRLAAKLKQSAQQPKVGESEDPNSMQVELTNLEASSSTNNPEGEEEEGVEGENNKKVSTHGPRMSGREVWKASKRGKKDVETL